MTNTNEEYERRPLEDLTVERCAASKADWSGRMLARWPWLLGIALRIALLAIA